MRKEAHEWLWGRQNNRGREGDVIRSLWTLAVDLQEDPSGGGGGEMSKCGDGG